MCESIRTCELDQCEDKPLRTQIILGISNKDIQTSLLREDLSLENVVINHCRAVKQTEFNRRVIQENNTKLLYQIGSNQKRKQTINLNYQFKESTSMSGYKNHCYTVNNKYVKRKRKSEFI